MLDITQDAGKCALLTTLWFTETTMADGTPYTPEPEVSLINLQIDSPNFEARKRAELAGRINAHNEWAREQEGRPVVKFAKQQVVLITPTTTELV